MTKNNCCNESCNVLCVPKEAKDINVKAFNMITNKNKAKKITKHISYICKCKFNSTACNSNQRWKNVNVNIKIIVSAKKSYSWNPSTYNCENSKYLKSIADTSVIECDEIITVMDIVSRKMRNTIAKRFAYIFISDHITIDNYHYYLQLLCKK